jgi:hypothetical protein
MHSTPNTNTDFPQTRRPIIYTRKFSALKTLATPCCGSARDVRLGRVGHDTTVQYSLATASRQRSPRIAALTLALPLLEGSPQGRAFAERYSPVHHGPRPLPLLHRHRRRKGKRDTNRPRCFSRRRRFLWRSTSSYRSRQYRCVSMPLLRPRQPRWRRSDKNTWPRG